MVLEGLAEVDIVQRAVRAPHAVLDNAGALSDAKDARI